MAVRHYRKPHQYRRKKSVLKQRFFWLSVLVLLAFSGIFYLFFFSVIFQAENITVSGNDKVSFGEVEPLVKKEIQNKVLFFETKSIFSVDTGKIRYDLLSSFPEIAEAKVSRKLFHSISVFLTERKGVAVWCRAEACFLIDKEGVIFEPVQESSLLRIRSAEPGENIELGRTVLLSEQISQIIKIRDGLGFPAVEALLASKERLNIETKEGWKIYFNLKGDLDWQLQELSLVLEKQISAKERAELEYVDLRFSRVFYK